MASMFGENHETGPDWEPISALCEVLVAGLPETAADLTSRLRQSLPVYRAVSRDQHETAVEDQLRRRIAAVAERRPLREADLSTAAELAESRAGVGVPIDAVIAAYQAGDQELWNLILADADAVPAKLLTEIASLILDSTRRTTSVMAHAHSRVARAMDGGRMTLSHQLMEYLDQPVDDALGAAVAGRLGLDPLGRFAGLVWRPAKAEISLEIPRIAGLLGLGPEAMVGRVGSHGLVELVIQLDGGTSQVPSVPLGREGGWWGVGSLRQGLHGASESLADARLALRATGPERAVAYFAEDWLESVLLAQGARIRPVIGRGIEVARQHPHLAQAVLAFADADMSIAAAAQRLHLHANSVTYRLERWGSLTGISARTFRGLSAAVVACRLAQNGGSPGR